MINDITFDKGLEDYLSNKFIKGPKAPSYNIDLTIWNKLIDDDNFFNLLKEFYPQLRFPINSKVISTDDYKRATLKGHDFIPERGLDLVNEELIQVSLHSSCSIKAPVIKVPNKNDFNQIVQALVYKNKPVDVPKSMGAILIKGLSNWGKIKALKSEFFENNPFGSWNKFFSEKVIKNKYLYQDDVIVLSNNSYSNVSASTLNLKKNEWKVYSMNIRLEHEFTHLYTLKNYGVISNSLHDELVADYIGISKALAHFNKEWMYHFMGIENYPLYRKGARLENYINDKITPDSFKELIAIIKKCIDNIYSFDQEIGKITSENDQRLRIRTLCETSLIEMSSPMGAIKMTKLYEHFS